MANVFVTFAIFNLNYLLYHIILRQTDRQTDTSISSINYNSQLHPIAMHLIPASSSCHDQSSPDWVSYIKSIANNCDWTGFPRAAHNRIDKILSRSGGIIDGWPGQELRWRTMKEGRSKAHTKYRAPCREMMDLNACTL